MFRVLFYINTNIEGDFHIFLTVFLNKFKEGKSRKKTLHFGKWSFLALILRIFRKRKSLQSFLYFGKLNISVTPRKYLIFQKMENPKKLHVFFQKNLFLCFSRLKPYRAQCALNCTQDL